MPSWGQLWLTSWMQWPHWTFISECDTLQRVGISNALEHIKQLLWHAYPTVTKDSAMLYCNWQCHCLKHKKEHTTHITVIWSGAPSAGWHCLSMSSKVHIGLDTKWLKVRILLNDLESNCPLTHDISQTYYWKILYVEVKHKIDAQITQPVYKLFICNCIPPDMGTQILGNTDHQYLFFSFIL